MSLIRVGVSGAAGRMGRRLVSMISSDVDLKLSAAFESVSHDKIGVDVGELAGVGCLGVLVGSNFSGLGCVDVLIDFSTPQATEGVVGSCVEFGVPLVFATTGTSVEQDGLIGAASRRIPVLTSPSMSLMVNVAMNLCKTAAKTLSDKDVDVEIVESHHRYKADSPSGTALKFGRIISEQMGLGRQVYGREGQVGARKRDEIGFHSIRIGDDPGGHSILFGLLGETLEISVKATSRDCYAIGAIAAAKFIHNKPPGMYNMNDLLEGMRNQ
ncbi:MAG: 4-hydroxy-tetrahydrodipicolinate reductase [Planctomycetaceae bacterium]|jgi:4-hydroxy-tetrahydrodipicolinate reductase|nr:4-hydroxy-tetrahydrodipicolinate reductase [Planctomycetaceae bacterium]